jgi:hypothetical protein
MKAVLNFFLKVLSFLAVIMGAVIGFFGVTHSSIALIAFVTGVFCGVPALPMFGISVGVGAFTALVYTGVGIIFNNLFCHSSFKACKHNKDHLAAVFFHFRILDEEDDELFDTRKLPYFQTPLTYAVFFSAMAGLCTSKSFKANSKHSPEEKSNGNEEDFCGRLILFANYGR